MQEILGITQQTTDGTKQTAASAGTPDRARRRPEELGVGLQARLTEP